VFFIFAANFYDKLSLTMTPFLQLAFELVIILLAAKLAGYLSTRLGQPSVLGELLIGVLLGPSLINILGLPFITSTSLGSTLSELSELGVLLLMFLAGLELHLGELAGNRKVAVLASAGGLLLSILLGWIAGMVFGMSSTSALLLGLALGATSVSISARTLLELGALRSRVGLGLLGAAVVDDILCILAFSIFMAVTTGAGGVMEVLWLVGRMALFFSAAGAFGLWVIPWLVRQVSKMHISQGMLALAIITLLVYGLVAELVGSVAAILGAFVAGLMFARTPEKNTIDLGMGALAHGLFVPIFFINIGLTVNLRQLQPNAVGLILVVTLAAVAGKLIGAAGGARLAGLPGPEALQLGTGMLARGEVTLIIAAVGNETGLLSGSTLSAIVVAVLISTLITPLLLRTVFLHLKPGVPARPAEKESEG
jgi:Kef-type K+ transport system membrane component KefB